MGRIVDILVLTLALSCSLAAAESRGGGAVVKKALENPVDEMVAELPVDEDDQVEGPVEQLAREGSLFKMDTLDTDLLDKMDCHMRNIDLCYAGLLSSLSKPLPENDADFEMRCDNMKVATACLAKYNERCQSFRLLSALGPTTGLGSSLPAEMRSFQLPEDVEEALVGSEQSKKAKTPVSITAGDLFQLCEPSAKNNETQIVLRRRLFRLARCVNERMPTLRPCIDDLKNALQIFYEPGRMLPVAPSCCALSRFRDCASRALDNICGLTSLSQLEASLSQGSSSLMTGSIVRTCRKAARFDSDECKELLPPHGIKLPPRSGKKASKLAKILELMSFGSTS